MNQSAQRCYLCKIVDGPHPHIDDEENHMNNQLTQYKTYFYDILINIFLFSNKKKI